MIQSLYSFSILTSFMFILANHPLTMGMILLIQVSLIAMITGMMAINFWFSYILFMIMVGGMLVLFIYMTSIASNEKFKLSKSMIVSIPVMSILIFSSFFMDQFSNYSMITNQDMMIKSTIFQKLTLSKYFNFPSNMIMILLIIYLLISLIAVIKITNISYGPLRQKF